MPHAPAVLGFLDEQDLVKTIAIALESAPQYAQEEAFSGGEFHLIGPEKTPERVVIVTNIQETAQSLFRACLLAQTARLQGAAHVALIAPWIAYGRQDRVTLPGQSPAGIYVGKTLSAWFDRIYTFDAHSQGFIDAFQGSLQNIYADPSLCKSLNTSTIVVAPDQGAIDRAQHVATLLNLPSTSLIKSRHEGVVTTTFQDKGIQWSAHIPLLVDDMADSGGTLISAATILREAGVQKVYAFIPHALRKHLLVEKSKGIIDVIEAAFDHQTHTYAPHQLSLLAEAYQRGS
ncbi:ribose-phosphate diphosphokinase [Patescibacteria group bacterium]|nr:ribose-phosphate diphosphokinase [Patescibacteria group bacterium]